MNKHTSAERVLIVEDSPTQAEALEMILAREGFDVDVAPNGEAALERLETSRYDLVLSDILMPGISGFELCRKIKTDPRHDVPVILLTALDAPEDMIRGLEAGAENYLTKPCQAEQVVNRAHAVLELRKQRRDRTTDAAEISFLGRKLTVRTEEGRTISYLLPILEDCARRQGAQDAKGGHDEATERATPVPETAGTSAHGEPGGPALATRARILLVEDSPTQAEHTRLLLVSQDFEVEVAATGEQALQLFETYQFDLVLADVVLPDTTGYDLCRRIRSGRRADVPVILVTSLDDALNIIEGLEAGANNFVVKPFQADQLLSRIEHAIAAGWTPAPQEPTPIETNFRGRTFEIAVTRSQVLDYLVAAFEDIMQANERVKVSRAAEEAALESKRFMQSTLDALRDHIAILDERGAIIAVNRAWRQFATANGFTVSNFGIGTNYLEVCQGAVGIGSDDAQAVAQGIRHVLSRKSEAFAFEYPCGSPDEERWFVVRATRFQDDTPVRVVVAHQDITEMVLAEQLVRESEEKYRGLVVNATYAIYRSTPDGRFLSVNPAMATMLGYDSEDQLLRMNIADIYCDPHDHEEIVAETLEAPRTVRKELKWCRKDGTTITVVVSGRPVRNDEGNVEFFDMIAEDVTEQRELEAQLRQAQKMEAVGQLTGGIAHDFNNLLTVVLANVDLLSESSGSRIADRAGDLEEIREAAVRGTTLIKKLLGFTRRERLEFNPVDLSHLVTELSTMLRRVVPENIEIELRAEEDPGVVQADSGAVEQIVFNLATNARDAMPDGGSLTIGVKRTSLDLGFRASHPWVAPGEYICVSVSDTGIGMDEATKQRIFEPFFTTKSAASGTGLGMAMIYGLVKQHKGFVHVYSELGKGTIIRVYFPLSREAPDEPVKERTISTTLPRGTETILVVEDELAIRRATKRALEAHGYTVLLAEDGEEGLEILASRGADIDLVLSDLIMPKLGGRQFHDALRQKGEKVKLLFASGYSPHEIYESAVLEPDVPFISKPWTISDLVGRVREVLDQQSTG